MNLETALSIVAHWQKVVADDLSLSELSMAVGVVADGAIAWRDAFTTLTMLRERIMPCGHAMENLIASTGTVTKCGQCLADKTPAANVDIGSFDCVACAEAAKLPLPLSFYPRMWTCATCGNKRCTRAANHANACIGSNEPGQ